MENLINDDLNLNISDNETDNETDSDVSSDEGYNCVLKTIIIIIKT